jgi:NADH-quinone oxidoreductase subunit L
VTQTALAWLVPALPFLGATAGLLLGRRAPGFVRPLAVLPTLAALVCAVTVVARQGHDGSTNAAHRLTPTGSIPIDLVLRVDDFSGLIAVAVGVVAVCVQVYSVSYLRDDPRYPSYAALVSLFTAAMLLVVYSGDLMVLLVGWEVMGICSYFLVGHYWETETARAASLKAFLVTKLGDVPFLLGIFSLAHDAGTFRIDGILTTATSGGLHHPTLTALLLLGGIAAKSAQFPLHTWLPDAMAGPTPVSALIHAATMVAAGVYLVARLLPVFVSSGAALVVMAVLAALTMIGSGLAALAQDDIKRVLAYSTIGQLGYMVGALAVGDRSAALFHLLSHAGFKALLFLAAGAVIHAAGTNSLSTMSRTGALRTRVPDATWTMGLGLIALAALPPLSGFFSKESVLRAAQVASSGDTVHVPSAAGWTVLAAGMATAVLTGAYATRLFLMAFLGSGPEAADHGRQPIGMTAVLWVLAVPTVAFGGLGYQSLHTWFGGASLTPTLLTSVLGTGLSLVGVLVTYGAWRAMAATRSQVPMGAVMENTDSGGEPALVEAEAIATHTAVYGDIAAAADPGDPGRLLLGPLHAAATHGFRLDAVYTALFVRPVLAAAGLVRFLDRDVVETWVRGAAGAPNLLGAAVRKAQTGNVQTYLSALLAGAVVLAVLVAVGG